MARGRSAGDDTISTTLVRAARQLLTSEGASALTVRRIATTAGVSTMCVYSRFGCKEGVVEELFVAGFRQLADAIEEPSSSDGPGGGLGDDPGGGPSRDPGRDPSCDPLGDLLALTDSYRRFAIANPALYAVMFDRAVPDFEPSEEAIDVARGTLHLLESKLQTAMEAGLLVPADPCQAAACIWGMCHGITSLELKEVGKEINWADTYRRACSTMLAGMARHDVSPE